MDEILKLPWDQLTEEQKQSVRAQSRLDCISRSITASTSPFQEIPTHRNAAERRRANRDGTDEWYAAAYREKEVARFATCCTHRPSYEQLLESGFLLDEVLRSDIHSEDWLKSYAWRGVHAWLHHVGLATWSAVSAARLGGPMCIEEIVRPWTAERVTVPCPDCEESMRGDETDDGTYIEPTPADCPSCKNARESFTRDRYHYRDCLVDRDGFVLYAGESFFRPENAA